MKILISVLFILSSVLLADSQTKTFTVSGKVINCKDKSPIKGIPLRIVCGDGKVIDGKTDDKGNYTLIAKPEKLPVACVIRCNFRPNMTDFSQWTTEKKKFMLCDLDSCSLKIAEIFCLVDMAEVEEIKFPDITFQKNIAFPEKGNEDNINKMIEIMNDHPNFTIEINGECDSTEINPIKLSLDRAKQVFELLEKKGIEEGRMRARGYEIKSPKQSNPSRKVIFIIIRKDYVSPKVK